jgi:preprotein translocase subunit SecD
MFLIVSICAFGVLFALPNFLSESVRAALPSWMPSQSVVTGTELSGGTSMLLEADMLPAIQDRSIDVLDGVRKSLRGAKLLYQDLRMSPSGDGFSVRIVDPAQLAAAMHVMTNLFEAGVLMAPDEYEIAANNGVISLTMSRAGRAELSEYEDNRLVQFVGRIVEPTDDGRHGRVSRAGMLRVRVELPGITDASQMAHP